MALHSFHAVYILEITLLATQMDREDNTFNN